MITFPSHTSMTISVRAECQYGVAVYYPADERAAHFAAIAGTKTLTPNTIAHVKALGYKIKVEQTLPLEL